MKNTEDMSYLSAFESAANYQSLSLAEKWDYCWSADLAQTNWLERCLAELPDCEYLTDLCAVVADMAVES